MNIERKKKQLCSILQEKKVVVYGAGKTTLQILSELPKQLIKNIVAIADSAEEKHGRELIDGKKVISPKDILLYKPEVVIISIQHTDHSLSVYYDLINELPNTKIYDLNNVNNFYKETDLAPIIVYQMGKVGSSTMLKSIENQHLKNPIYHEHMLSNNFEIASINGKIKPQIITLVRDPISRLVSAFFHGVRRWDIAQDIVEDYKKGKKGSIDRLIELFFDPSQLSLTSFQEQFISVDYTLSWFDNELKKVFDIDVYASRFPKEEGYDIFNNVNANVLLLKLEKINMSVNSAMYKFLHLNNFEIINSNIILPQNNLHYNLYRDFVKGISFSNQFIHNIYDTKYVKHFYSESEVEEFLYKWTK